MSPIVTLPVLPGVGAAVGARAPDAVAMLGAALGVAADGVVAAPHVTARTQKSDRIALRRIARRIESVSWHISLREPRSSPVFC